MTITVYSEPASVPGDATHRALEMSGLAYEVIDITEDPAARHRMASLGYRQTPVVVVGEDHWSGHRPERIRALVVRTAALA